MVLRSIDKCREVSIREAATLGGHNSCSECIVGQQEVMSAFVRSPLTSVVTWPIQCSPEKPAPAISLL
jgi:hypothetical protein